MAPDEPQEEVESGEEHLEKPIGDIEDFLDELQYHDFADVTEKYPRYFREDEPWTL